MNRYVMPAEAGIQYDCTCQYIIIELDPKIRFVSNTDLINLAKACYRGGICKFLDSRRRENDKWCAGMTSGVQE